MNSTGIIDKFLDTYSSYINSGFGLLGGEVAFLATTLVTIDVILAALFWALSDEDVIASLIKKTLYYYCVTKSYARIARLGSRPQHGHRDRRVTIALMSRRRIVAMEFGMCRSGRKGGSSGSVTFG
jgi:hypothetical protein